MSRSFVVEKTLRVIVTEDDLLDDEVLTEALALEIANDIDTYEWQQVDISVAGVQ